MKKSIRVFHILVSTALLIYLLNWIDLSSLKTMLVNMNLRWVAGAFFVILLATFLKVYRWQILLFTQKLHISFKKSLTLNLIGNFFNYFFPSLTGGDIIKGWMLVQEKGNWREIYSSLIVDRVIGITALCSLVLVSFSFFGHKLAETNVNFLIWIAVVIPFTILIAYFFRKIWVKIVFKILSNTKLGEEIQKGLVICKNYLMWRKNMGVAFFISIIIQFSDVLICYCLGQSLNIKISIIFFFLFVPLITLASLMPISFNGLGVREGAYILLFSPLNVDKTLIITLSLSYYFLNFSLGIAGGILYFLSSFRTGRQPIGKITLPYPQDFKEANSATNSNIK